MLRITNKPRSVFNSFLQNKTKTKIEIFSTKKVAVNLAIQTTTKNVARKQ